MGVGTVLTFDPKSFSLTFKGRPLDGWDKSKFSLEFEEQGISAEVGTEGDTLQIMNYNRNAKVTLNLLPGHPTNAFLSGTYNNNLVRPGAGNGMAEIKDCNGNTHYSSAVAWITQLPGPSTGATPGSMVWTLYMTGVSADIGSSVL